MIIRKATEKDINSIVDIHIDAFKSFFLTSLGSDFLRFYYSCFIKSDETVITVAEEDGVILGFSASTMLCRGFNSRLIKKNFLSFAALSIKLIFVSPKSLFRLIKNLTKKSNDVEDDEEYAELYSIGVAKTAQGKGVGKKLLSYSESIMKENGAKQVSLTTDFDNNETTIGFYHSMGYQTLYTFTTYPNRKMYRLIKVLD